MLARQLLLYTLHGLGLFHGFRLQRPRPAGLSIYRWACSTLSLDCTVDYEDSKLAATSGAGGCIGPE
jgi:hypothetical protein